MGTASSLVDLHPTNFVSSTVTGVSGTQQVGLASNSPSALPSSHAFVWNGTAQSGVDLHPVQVFPDNYSNSVARGTDGTHQVGGVEYVAFEVANIHHAALWKGTAASFVDLHPASGYFQSEAVAVAGDQQVGWGATREDGFGKHALLWSGSAASVVDLHPNINSQSGDPDFFYYSVATGTNGIQQVGGGEVWEVFRTRRHALLWNGTSESAVDLHLLLPPGFTESWAHTIDAAGNVWGLAVTTDGLRTHAVKWTPVPEPCSSLLGVIGFAAALVVAQRRMGRARHWGHH
jgi:hypothetical protein